MSNEGCISNMMPGNAALTGFSGPQNPDANLALFPRVKAEPWDWSANIPSVHCPSMDAMPPPQMLDMPALGSSVPPQPLSMHLLQPPAHNHNSAMHAKKKSATKPRKESIPLNLEVKTEMKQEPITASLPVKKKRDRFNGMSEEEVLQRTLPDHLYPKLDILIIGINPGLTAAYVGHHYAGPGNHFWKCLYLSGLIPEPMNAYDDRRLQEYGIGFTNMVSRTSRGSVDLTKKEIKEGADILQEKIAKFKPKIAVFNGKGIYEVFCGHKKFCIGKQPEPFPGSPDTLLYVMPSSSARCSQLPRAIDKVPFYLALKKLRDHTRGDLKLLDDSEVTFPDLELKVEPKKPKPEPLDGDTTQGKRPKKRRKLDGASGGMSYDGGSLQPPHGYPTPHGMPFHLPPHGLPIAQEPSPFYPLVKSEPLWGPPGFMGGVNPTACMNGRPAFLDGPTHNTAPLQHTTPLFHYKPAAVSAATHHHAGMPPYPGIKEEAKSTAADMVAYGMMPSGVSQSAPASVTSAYNASFMGQSFPCYLPQPTDGSTATTPYNYVHPWYGPNQTLY